MGKDKLITLIAEEGMSLSSGSLRLYGVINPPTCLRGASEVPPTAKSAKKDLIGCVDFYAYDPLNRRAAVGIMVAAKYRRQGYGIAMLQELQQLATSNYSLHTLYADIAASNTASLALFKKAGYTQCGHFKEWLEYDSHFIDNIRMQLIL